MVRVRPFVLVAVGFLAAGTRGQSFNIDCNVAAGVGAGVPTDAFAGAALQAGRWNNIGVGTGPFALVDLAGAGTGVTLSRTNGTLFNFNNANTSGDFQLLFDDIHDLGAAPGASTYTISGLFPGVYSVFVYAIAPDSSTARTSIFVSGSTSTNPQACGGVMPVNSFALGVNFTQHIVTVPPTGAGANQITIICTGTVNLGSVNGLQLRLDKAGPVFVDASAGGLNNGRTWPNAFTDLQSALDLPPLLRASSVEIWVADGMYFPSKRTDAADARSACFQSTGIVNLYGGFNGTETMQTQRDPAVNECTLSGERGASGPGDNCYNVILVEATTTLAYRIFGFTISGANNTRDQCAGDCVQSYGGGLFNNGAPIIVRDCIFRDNNAGCESGMGCPAISAGFGGGMLCLGANAAVVGCTFLNNTARFGAGLWIEGDSRIANCRFLGNDATLSGGGARGADTCEFHNCFFSGNTCGDGSSIQSGAAFHTSNPNRLINCTFVGNTGPAGVETISNNPAGASTLTISNCIVWNNPGIGATQGTVSISHSDIQGGAVGTMNLNVDPLFVDADGPDNTFGTPDDDPRLSGCSPVIDAGSNSLLPLDSADVDGDNFVGETLPLDLLGAARRVESLGSPNTGTGTSPIVDMGAHEYPGTPPLTGDADFDRDVDFNDTLEVLASFGADYGPPGSGPGDADGDGDVDFNDVLAVLSGYGAMCP